MQGWGIIEGLTFSLSDNQCYKHVFLIDEGKMCGLI